MHKLFNATQITSLALAASHPDNHNNFIEMAAENGFAS